MHRDARPSQRCRVGPWRPWRRFWWWGWRHADGWRRYGATLGWHGPPIDALGRDGSAFDAIGWDVTTVGRHVASCGRFVRQRPVDRSSLRGDDASRDPIDATWPTDTARPIDATWHGRFRHFAPVAPTWRRPTVARKWDDPPCPAARPWEQHCQPTVDAPWRYRQRGGDRRTSRDTTGTGWRRDRQSTGDATRPRGRRDRQSPGDTPRAWRCRRVWLADA